MKKTFSYIMLIFSFIIIIIGAYTLATGLWEKNWWSNIISGMFWMLIGIVALNRSYARIVNENVNNKDKNQEKNE